MGDSQGLAIAQRLMADVHRARGELTTAVALYEGVLEMWRRLDNRHGMAQVIGRLGQVSREMGDIQRGSSSFTRD